MTKSKRRIIEETPHFQLSADRMGKHVLRYIARCLKCNKEKSFAGGIKHLKWKCCEREFERDLD